MYIFIPTRTDVQFTVPGKHYIRNFMFAFHYTARNRVIVSVAFVYTVINILGVRLSKGHTVIQYFFSYNWQYNNTVFCT